MARANTRQSEWQLREDDYDYHQEVANAGFGDMLHDKERNEKYYEALRSSIAHLHQLGRKVNVLDIGTGTGILSMMAARAGADSVVACEAFLPMAVCAERIIKANGMEAKIKLVKKRSTDLIVGEDLPQLANLLVAEVLDTELIGEGAIAIYNHAHANLLTDDAICIPHKAKCYAQVAQSMLAAQWNTLKVLPNLDGDILLKPSKDMIDCKGEASLHDVQLSQLPLEKFTILSEPIEIFEFDFAGKQDLAMKRDRQILTRTVRPGTTDLVFFWWSIDMDPYSTVTLSCAPFWAHPELSKLSGLVSPKRPLPNVVPWRDHWMQAIYHIPKPQLLPSKGTEFILSCHHDEFSFWFDINMPLANSYSDSDPDSASKSNAIESIPRHACSCHLHNTFSRNRIAMLNNALRNKVYLRHLEKIVDQHTQMLVLGDGCLLGLAAAKMGAKKVIVHESQRMSRHFMESMAQYNQLANVQFVDKLDEISDGSLGELTHIFAEPYFLNSIFPWDNLYYGALISTLQPKLKPNIQISPMMARLFVCPIEFIDLHKIRQPVGTVEGFDLSLFDEMVDNSRALAHARVEAHPLWEYPCRALGAPCELLTVQFDKYAHDKTCEIPIYVERNGSLNAMAIWTDFSVDGRCTNQATISTGPIDPIYPGFFIKWDMTSRQGVHFFKMPYDMRSERSYVRCRADFKPSSGKIHFKFDVCT